MTALIGALRVSLSADTANFEAGMKRAQRTTRQSVLAMEKSLATLKAGLAGFASALSVGLLARGIKGALDYAGSLGEVAQSLGVTTKELQTFRFAAQQNGATLEQADQALGKFAVSISKAKSGSETAQKAFKAVGVELVDLRTKSRSELLGQIADKMKETGGAANNAAAGVAIFGKGFLSIAPTLDQGSSGMNELAAAAERLGIVLSDEQIRNADETADKLEAVKTVLAAQIAGVVANNAASILQLASSLGQLTSAIVNFLNSNPQLALGIIGALAGGRVGGLPGAAIGGIAGATVGNKMALGQAEQKLTKDAIPLLRHNLIKESNTLRAQRQSGKIDPAQIAKVRRLTDKLNAATGNTPVSSVSPVALPQFLQGGGGGGGKKTRKPRADHSDERALREAHQFDEDMRRADMDTLRAKLDLAHNSEDRSAIQLQMLKLDKDSNDADLQYQQQLYKLTDGQQGLSEEQAKQLKAKQDATYQLEVQAIQEEKTAEAARDAAELADHAKDIEIEKLELESQLATTGKQKRDAELRILEAMKAQEKARLDAVIADTQSSDLAKQEAQQRLDNLDAIYAGRREATMQQTAGPMEQWTTQFSDISDELQDLKVHGIEAAADALTHLTEGWDSFRDAAISAIKQVIAELIRLQIMKAIANIAGAAAGAPGGGGFGGASSLGGGLAMGAGGLIPGFATGGSMILGGKSGVDRNILSLNGLPIARVSRGEPMHIGTKEQGFGGGGTTINAPITIMGTASRETTRQMGAELARRMADARKSGY